MSRPRTTATSLWLIVFVVLFGFLLTSCTGPPPVIGDPKVVDPSTPVPPGAEVSVSIDVTASKSVSYQWKTDEGDGQIIKGETSSAIVWQAPQEPGLYNVYVEVTIDNVVTEKSVVIEVVGETNTSAAPPTHPPAETVTPDLMSATAIADALATQTAPVPLATETPKLPPTPTNVSPTATEGVEYIEGEVLFEDDFEDGDADPAEWHLGEGLSVVQDETGNYVLRDSPPSVLWTQAVAGDISWQDYALEFKGKIIESSPQSPGELDISVRVNWDRAGCRRYLLALGTNGSGIGRNGIPEGVEDSSCPWTELDRHTIALAPGRWYKVRIEAYDSRITVYLDGRELLYTDDREPLLTGQFILAAPPGATVDYDDVRVVELIPASRSIAEPASPEASPSPVATSTAPATSARSPQRFVFSDEGDIFVSYRDGAGNQQLTFTEEEEYGPTWSPDGKKIVFQRISEPGTWGDLWIMDADGGNQTRLTFAAPAHDSLMPVWSPDGESIVFIHQGGVAEINPDGSNLRFIVLPSETAKVNPVISPDGSRIAYNEILPGWDGPPPFTSTIVVVNRDGTGLKVIHTRPQRESTNDEDRYFPAWSPDGTKIGFQDFDGVTYAVEASGDVEPEVFRDSIQSWYPTYWPQWDKSDVRPTGELKTSDQYLEAAIGSAQDDPQAAFAVAALQAVASRAPTRQDDFSDPSSGFGEIRLEDSFAGYENGVYLMESQPDTCCVNSNIIGDYTDLVVQLDMHFDAIENGNVSFGAFLLRMTSAGTYGFQLDYNGEKTGYTLSYTRYMTPENEWNRLASGVLPSGLDTAIDAQHNLIAVAVGNQIAYFIDGMLVYAVKDNTFTQGGIALSAGWGSTVRVDNLRLWDVSDLP